MVPAPLPGRRRDREGARHGRAPLRETAADSVIRVRLVRLAAVPCLLVAATCSAVTAFIARSGDQPLSGAAWTVLGCGFALVCGITAVACAAATSEARATIQRYARLREVCARSQSDLYALVHRVRQGEWLQQRAPEPLSRPAGDTLDLLVHDVAAAGRAAETAVIDAVAIARGNASGSEQKVEVFVNLARRLQSLVHREIELLDELENRVEDPDLLKGLFHVDHLATRIRRHAENLAVLGGAISRRQWSRPVTMTEVMRSSIAEVEQYPRVKLVPPIEGTLRGHAVADVIHLLAELVENATVYSAPHTHILLRAQLVTAGLAVEVEDRGLGMDIEEQDRMNALLADPDHVDVAELLNDGRIGLFVVSSLARRHGVVVRLQSNIYGGVQAVLILPQGLLGDEQAGEEDDVADSAARPAVAAAPPAEPPRRRVVRTANGHTDADAGLLPPAAAPPRPDRPAPPAAPPAPAARPATIGARTATGAHTATGAPEGAAAGPTEPRRDAAHADARAPGSGRTAAADAPTAAAAPGPEAGPGPVVLPPAPPVTTGDRPRLPRRRKQEHLVPELRADPTPPGGTRTAGRPEPEHDPDLMAAFRRGITRADDAYDAAVDRGTAYDSNSAYDSAAYEGGAPYDNTGTGPSPGRSRGDDQNHGE
ncbi:sensor histidine kinase [Streptomyces ochraceiscleroticus]|uniref:sensor histidine kinase n=1 Tax=Streptomyces ochraceiscleroticus TaxID=47761 RepID=UPI000B0E9C34|nr:ATP-binding protein [Streptomyces ochraceiscleroticus]